MKFREGIEKGPQMLAGPPTDLFEEKFVRIFDGEALHEPWRIEAKEQVIARCNWVEFIHRWQRCLSSCVWHL